MIEGLYYYTREEIEQKVEQIFGMWFPEYLVKSKIFAWERFCKKIGEEYNVKVTINANLGNAASGFPILGAFSLSPREIFIDVSIRYDKGFLVVLAHEIGHLILHRKLKFNPDSDNGLTDTLKTLSNPKSVESDNEIIEWQANAFACSVLMPRGTFYKAMLRAQHVLGLKQKLVIQVTNHPDSIAEYNNIANEMAKWCFVPQRAIKIRLHELGLVRGPGAVEGHISSYL